MRRVSVPILGMRCAACAAKVEGAIKRLRGVGEVVVNLAAGRAAVSLLPGADLGEVVEAVRKAGYDVPTRTVSLLIDGMRCAAKAERAIKGVEGVLSANVNLASGRAAVTYIPGLADLSGIRRAVEEAGYGAAELSERAEEAEDADRLGLRLADHSLDDPGDVFRPPAAQQNGLRPGLT